MTSEILSQTALADAAATLEIASPDMLNALVSLGRQAGALDVRVLTIAEPVAGLPQRVTVGERAGATPEMYDLRAFFERYRTAPERRSGTARVTTLESFVELTNRHKDRDSALFAQTSMPAPSLTAIVDYHRRAESTDEHLARFGAHRVVYEFPLTEEFKAWAACDGKAMSQADFAMFIEEHIADIAAATVEETKTFEPLFKDRFAAPIDLVALSRNLEITVGMKVKRKEILKSGERSIVFEDEHKTSAGDPVDIPGIFMLCLPAFIDGAPLRMPARLRYRIAGGDVQWFYQLYRPAHWLREQVRDAMISAAVDTGLPAYEGAPETA